MTLALVTLSSMPSDMAAHGRCAGACSYELLSRAAADFRTASGRSPCWTCPLVSQRRACTTRPILLCFFSDEREHSASSTAPPCTETSSDAIAQVVGEQKFVCAVFAFTQAMCGGER